MSQKLKEINGDTSYRQGNGQDLSARKASLTPLEYRVTQQRETERPFSNKYNKHWEAGVYYCVVCDAELFKSETKFESKSGWPAFYNVVDPQRVKLTPDLSHIGANLLLLIAKPDLARTEVSCANCNAHLGHLFKDGPKPTGLRYCINSASLNFKSLEESNDSIEISTSSATVNGKGLAPTSVPIREYICNPENMCSRPSPVVSKAPSKDSNVMDLPKGKTVRDNFFNDTNLENKLSSNLPPMGALCLNNQTCQRQVTVTKPSNESFQNTRSSAIVSNGVENQIETGSRTTTVNSPGSNHNSNHGATNLSTTQLSAKPKYGHSKGVSLTAARINFFQKISVSQDPSIQPPSRWAATFNSRWSSSNNTASPRILSANNTTDPGDTRFPSSCSSGSLYSLAQQSQSSPEEVVPTPRRSTSSFFLDPSNETPIQQRISSPPKTVALRETTL